MAAITVIVAGASGDGKTTSIIVDENGKLPFKDGEFNLESYKGIDPGTTVVINSDGKIMPFPYKKLGFIEGKNLFTSTYANPITAEYLLGDTKNVKNPGLLEKINRGTNTKRIIIDTMNGLMNDKEMLETRNLSWDKWYDLAKDIYAVISKANSLRDDLIIYIFAHVALYTDVDGEETKGLLTTGKKLEKIKLESKAPLVLVTNVTGSLGDNKYVFETRKNRSIAKTPVGMFKDFLIPNSLCLVDKKIREFFGIDQ